MMVEEVLYTPLTYFLRSWSSNCSAMFVVLAAEADEKAFVPLRDCADMAFADLTFASDACAEYMAGERGDTPMICGLILCDVCD